MTAAIDYNAINAKAEQTRAMVDKAYKVANKTWEDTLKALAELATMYGINPAKVYIKNAYEDSVDDEVRLVACGWDGCDHGLHEDLEIVDRFVADAEYLLGNSMFIGFFHRDVGEYGLVKVVS